jgi:hypothetical protein
MFAGNKYTKLIHTSKIILWHVDLLLGSDREISYYTTAIASNSSTNKHVSMATIALQETSGISYAVHSEMF